MNPIFEYTGKYSNQLVGAIANVAVVSGNYVDGGGEKTYRDGQVARALRGGITLQPSSLSAASTRFSTDQANAYRRPEWATRIGQGLPDAYSAQSCGTTVPRLPDTDNAELNKLESQGPGTGRNIPDVSALDAIRYTLFNPLGFYSNATTAPENNTPSQSPAPTTPQGAPRDCTVQSRFALGAGRLTTYPQLPAAPTSTRPSVTGP